MALTGIQIYKLLPKTNCKECGFPTCLAFAMALAQKKVALDKCPDVSDEAKQALAAESAPPIMKVKLGTGEAALAVGEETELFRHERRFENPCGVAVMIADNDPELDAKIKATADLNFTRVGLDIRVELIAIQDASGDAGTFKAAVDKAAATDRILILMSENPENMKAAAEGVKDGKPLLYGAGAGNWEAMAGVAAELGLALGVRGKDIDELAELTNKIKAKGVKEMMIDPGSATTRGLLVDLTQIRRLALKKGQRALGYPVIVFPGGNETQEELANASMALAKYAGIVVIKSPEKWKALALLALRQNVFTDPQKPIQVEAKVYEIGEVDDRSPVLLTTNFSLTYFTVEGEVEASRVPSYILVTDTEGMSVLTAFAADKMTAETVSKSLKDSGLEGRLGHKKLIIPGYVAVMSGALQEECGWEVLVGPREASAIPAYLKTVWKA
jgi:acetyl-CoA decarbonylase/synthase complex subunit gamma